MSVFRHVQVCVNFHCRADAGMSDALRKGSQVKIGIILVLQVVVCHIGVPEAVNGDGMGEADCFTNLVMGLIGASGIATAEWIGGRTADIAVLMPDGVKFFSNLAFG